MESTSSKILAGIGAFLFMVVLILALGPGLKAYSRYEARQDAQNQVEINRIKIKQHEQLVEIEEQEAERRIVEARGIAESQRIIDSSLTDQYLTYRALEVQQYMAESPNHTVIYLPIGDNGLPLVRDTSGDE